MVAPMSFYQDEEFWANPEQALRYALQQQGLNPDRNWMAQRMMARASELTPLARLYGRGTEGFTDFIGQYVNSMFGRGGSGANQFSNAALRNRLQGVLANPNENMEEWLMGGDREQQFQNYMSLYQLGQRGMDPAMARAAQAIQGRQFADWWNRTTTNPNTGPQTWLDFVRGNTGAAPGTTPVTSPYTPPTSPPTGQVPGPTPGSPGPGTPAPGANFASWQDVVNYMMQGHDARNLMTEGMRGPGRAFSFGGITYDPTQQRGHGLQSRDPNSRFGGGAAWTGFIYRYNLLKSQRDAGGNPAAGVTPNMTDDQIARMAAQWVNQNYRGQTGFSVA